MIRIKAWYFLRSSLFFLRKLLFALWHIRQIWIANGSFDWSSVSDWCSPIWYQITLRDLGWFIDWLSYVAVLRWRKTHHFLLIVYHLTDNRCPAALVVLLLILHILVEIYDVIQDLCSDTSPFSSFGINPIIISTIFLQLKVPLHYRVRKPNSNRGIRKTWPLELSLIIVFTLSICQEVRFIHLLTSLLFVSRKLLNLLILCFITSLVYLCGVIKNIVHHAYSSNNLRKVQNCVQYSKVLSICQAFSVEAAKNE